MAIWYECHSFVQAGIVRNAYPDGGSLIEQPAITIAMFTLIAEQSMLELKAEMNREA